MDLKFLQSLIVPAQTKIVMLIMDGLGGLPCEPGGKTELETARTPKLDALAELSALGLSQPAGPGITVGSGPGHLALFGYDPIENEIGRGALEVLGVDFDMLPGDVAARGNFCTIDANGIVTDRRAGRIPSEASQKLVELLETIQIDGAEFFVRLVKEHRFAYVVRSTDLEADVNDTDPLKNGLPYLKLQGSDPKSEKTACLVNKFVEQARIVLKDQQPANMILLRGFACLPKLPTFGQLYGLKAASIAVNGMYRGVSRLAGMDVLPIDGVSLADQINVLESVWQDYDFFYIHVKKTDTFGEKGDFAGKVAAIEEVDGHIPRIMALQPDVMIVGGDHSSPTVYRGHSWHPVPTLIYSKYARPDGIAEFGERVCARGSLGVFPAKHILPIALANAGRVTKYGA
jgi:2,3-bisphosphoglycerate-independent phosphoglycerate mutase